MLVFGATVLCGQSAKATHKEGFVLLREAKLAVDLARERLALDPNTNVDAAIRGAVLEVVESSSPSESAARTDLASELEVLVKTGLAIQLNYKDETHPKNLALVISAGQKQELGNYMVQDSQYQRLSRIMELVEQIRAEYSIEAGIEFAELVKNVSPAQLHMFIDPDWKDSLHFFEAMTKDIGIRQDITGLQSLVARLTGPTAHGASEFSTWLSYVLLTVGLDDHPSSSAWMRSAMRLPLVNLSISVVRELFAKGEMTLACGNFRSLLSDFTSEEYDPLVRKEWITQLVAEFSGPQLLEVVRSPECEFKGDRDVQLQLKELGLFDFKEGSKGQLGQWVPLYQHQTNKIEPMIRSRSASKQRIKQARYRRERTVSSHWVPPFFVETCSLPELLARLEDLTQLSQQNPGQFVWLNSSDHEFYEGYMDRKNCTVTLSNESLQTAPGQKVTVRGLTSKRTPFIFFVELSNLFRPPPSR